MKIVGVTFTGDELGVRFERARPEDAAWTVKGKALEKLFEDGPIYGGVTIIVEIDDGK